MTINKTCNDAELTYVIEGRLDTTTAPELEADLKKSIDGVTSLVFDMKDLEYVSSAGLRVLLAAQKVMNRQGSMVLRNVKSEVLEVLEVTGFTDILTIE